MNAKKNIITVIFVIILLCFIMKPIFIIIGNNRLSDYFSLILKTQRPVQARACDKISMIGHFVGNGNHLDFINIFIFRTNLTKKEILDFYSKNYPETDVIFLSDNEYNIKYTFHEDVELEVEKLLHEKKYRNSKDGMILYAIYSFHSLPDNGDIRGW